MHNNKNESSITRVGIIGFLLLLILQFVLLETDAFASNLKKYSNKGFDSHGAVHLNFNGDMGASLIAKAPDLAKEAKNNAKSVMRNIEIGTKSNINKVQDATEKTKDKIEELTNKAIDKGEQISDKSKKAIGDAADSVKERVGQ